jgi:PAS domain S-box-containing protein
MQVLHRSRRLALLLLATAGLYALDLHLAATSDHKLSGMHFLPFIAGMAWLPLAPLTVLAAVGWLLALYSTQLGPAVVGNNPGVALIVETAAIGLCLWASCMRCRLDRTRALLETMQHHAPVGIALLDQQGRIRQLNPAMVQLLGRDQETLVGQPWEAFSSHRAEAGERRCQQLRTPNGWRHVEVVARTWPGPSNTPGLGLLIQALDCQERVEAQESLQAERNQLRQNLRTSLLSATLIHEIKQPLAALLLQSRLLLSQQEQEPAANTAMGTQLHGLLSSAEQLQGTVDAVAALLRSCNLTLTDPVDLGALIDSCLAAQGHQLAALEVGVLRSGFEGPMLVWADSTPLQILIDNLLRNALEALEGCPASQRRLQLVLKRLPPNVQLTISDSGPGLPDKALNNLPLRSSKPSGLGLGLFTAETIARQHGGSLQAGRCPQLGGAAVHLTLPLGNGQGRANNDEAPPGAPAQSR